MPDLFALSPYFYAEPLVNHWGAWWLTLAPVPSSLHLEFWQLRALRSYIQNPEIHAQLAAKQSLSGSPFLDIPAHRRDEVARFLEHTEHNARDLLALSEAVRRTEEMLAEAKGQSLASFYVRLPAPLKGLVELVYDYQNRASLRVIEGMAYRSAYYRRDFQSLSFNLLENDSDRKFLFSTPRLPGSGALELPWEFASPKLDEFFRLDIEARSLAEIADLVQSPEARVLPFLVPASRAPRPSRDADRPTVKYVGHATVLIEWKGVSIITDPVIGPASKNHDSRITFEQLPDVLDYALITHAHADHFALDTLLRLRHRIKNLVVPRSFGLLLGDVSLKQLAQTLGFRSVIEMDTLERLPLVDGEIIAAPFLGEHGDLAHGKGAYVVRMGNRQVLFAADSACVDDTIYQRLKESVGAIDTVFMNTETEGSPLTYTIEPLFPRTRDRSREKDRRCRGSTANEALRLLKAVGARRLYIYAMGLEPWLGYLLGPPSPLDSARMLESDRLVQEARQLDIYAERLNGSRDLKADEMWD